jgi:7,8-dihydroneopterin aldolase/epimerase/oxygenase
MEFFAYHGYYDEEQKIGNRYTVNVIIETNFMRAAQEDLLEGTINYGEIYEIIKEEMQVSARLLEHLAYKMLNQIFETYPTASKIDLSIRKHNPPIGGVCEYSNVVLKTDRITWQNSK